MSYKDYREELAVRILAGFASNPAIFAANERCGWALVNCTDADIAAYAVRLADELMSANNARPPAKAIPANMLYSADYEGMAAALADLLKQVSKFCEENGEAEFYTGNALAALGLSNNVVHLKTLNDLRSTAQKGTHS